MTFRVFSNIGRPRDRKSFFITPLDHLLYTGSNVIAKKVLQNTANNLVPTTLELGGKSPTIISGDANLKLAAKNSFAKTKMQDKFVWHQIMYS